jgi:cyclopropane-fatty-acyl-phospholipid synthase
MADPSGFSNKPRPPLRVAVIGAGVAGLGCAWHLARVGDEPSSSPVDVTVFEASERAGGHANTVEVQLEGEQAPVPVDTGFMVYNESNYPNLVKWWRELGVPEGEDTDMSFAVSLDGGGFEWGSKGLPSLFADPRRLFSPSFYGMLRDMIRFNREAPDLLRLDVSDPRRSVTMGEYLKHNRYSAAFAEGYLVPMAAALWSSSTCDVLNFSAITLISFLHNHRMLQIWGRPQWKTPAGRSRKYVEACLKVLGNRVELGNAVQSAMRDDSGKWIISDSGGRQRQFDCVAFCVPADVALSLLGADAYPDEVEALSSFSFASNATYVHSDERLMPLRRAAWSAWNYIGTRHGITKGEARPVYVTYWLNKLQNLTCGKNIFVSLNPLRPPHDDKTHAVLHYRHPQFSPKSEMAQRAVSEINGQTGAWFCGAWMGYGFHEDGLRSGLEAAVAITGQPLPWNDEGLVLSIPRTLVGAPQHTLVRRVLLEPACGALTAIAVVCVSAYLRSTLVKGALILRLPDGRELAFGETSQRRDVETVVLRIYDWWFFVRIALEFDLGLARSYLSGEWRVEEEGGEAEGDGLARLFLLLISNRDPAGSKGIMHVSKLATSWVGYTLNWIRLRFSLDNSLSGSRSNIQAHYDLSNDLFVSFLDTRLMMYSSAIYDARLESDRSSLTFSGTLEEAQLRKVDTLIARAKIDRDHHLLDIGFGWGGIAIRAAEVTGCRVTGITLSKEQKALAEHKVREQGLEHLVHFELIDYRRFARLHPHEFDRIISCEMIEAVGHNYLGEFFAAVERMLKPDGIFVMEAITTPESHYPVYRGSSDFINQIIFPGSCCPSLHALLEAMAIRSNLTLESYDNIGMHYAETLREWRHRFNEAEPHVRNLGFDSIFIRCWNYYLTYCEAGFEARYIGCTILTFSRPCNAHLLSHSETQCICRDTVLGL